MRDASRFEAVLRTLPEAGHIVYKVAEGGTVPVPWVSKHVHNGMVTGNCLVRVALPPEERVRRIYTPSNLPRQDHFVVCLEIDADAQPEACVLQNSRV